MRANLIVVSTLSLALRLRVVEHSARNFPFRFSMKALSGMLALVSRSAGLANADKLD